MDTPKLCAHELDPRTCMYCKPSPYPQVVYTSGGGESFHRTKSCWGLTNGQRKVERRGGTAAKVVARSPGAARNDNYVPCAICFGSDETYSWTSSPVAPTTSRSARDREPTEVWVVYAVYSVRSRARHARYHDSEACPRLTTTSHAEWSGITKVRWSTARSQGMRPCQDCCR